jgi:hypothetical protein
MDSTETRIAEQDLEELLSAGWAAHVEQSRALPSPLETTLASSAPTTFPQERLTQHEARSVKGENDRD